LVQADGTTKITPRDVHNLAVGTTYFWQQADGVKVEATRG